jgi:hypothetical protein
MFSMRHANPARHSLVLSRVGSFNSVRDKAACVLSRRLNSRPSVMDSVLDLLMELVQLLGCVLHAVVHSLLGLRGLLLSLRDVLLDLLFDSALY